jgi:hypothetical protein
MVSLKVIRPLLMVFLKVIRPLKIYSISTHDFMVARSLVQILQPLQKFKRPPFCNG